ncbi:MAG: hypothetical protein K2L33_05315, partial [Muribaculaceae bacterium]|nr:hypothetical protein [Muribaculaceae bacterium]
MENVYFTPAERENLAPLYRRVRKAYDAVMMPDDSRRLRRLLAEGVAEGHYGRDHFGFNLLLHRLQTVELMASALSPDRSMATSLLLAPLVESGFVSAERIGADWGPDVAKLVNGFCKVDSLYERTASVQDENFRNLLLT